MRFWHDLTTADFDSLDPERTVALLPVGAIEQHGPHLPLSTDAVIAQAIAQRAAAAAVTADAATPVLVLPCQSIGKSNEHIDFPGTLTFSADALMAQWTQIGESVRRAGVRKLVYLNAHGGQPQVMEMVGRDLRVNQQMFVVSASWWQMGLPDVGIDPEEVRHGIHGGLVETSMMLHLRPKLVRMQHADDFRSVLPDVEARYKRLRLLGGVSAGWQAQDLHPLGVAGDARGATAALGEAIVEHAAAAVATLLEEVSHYPLSNLKPPPTASHARRN